MKEMTKNNNRTAMYEVILAKEPIAIEPYVLKGFSDKQYIAVGVLSQPCVKISEIGDKVFSNVNSFDIDSLEKRVNTSSKIRAVKINTYFTSVGFSKSSVDNEIKVRLTLYHENTMNLLKVIYVSDYVYTRLSFSENRIYLPFLNKSISNVKPVTKDIIEKMHETVKLLN
jgi:hypothetical protein